MTDPSDAGLTAWARDVLPGVEVSLAAPVSTALTERGVNLYLLELRSRPAMRGTMRDPLQLALNYLVRTWAPDPADAHSMLLDLCFAAMEEPDFDVDLDPIGPELWQALGVVPGPAFRVSMPIRRVRPQPVTKPVLHPLQIEGTTLGSVAGWVRTPDDAAIPGATVEVPALDRQSLTDSRGRFQIEAIPAAPGRLDIRVRAKGKEAWATVGAKDDRDAVLIRLDPLEDSDGGLPHP
jgi:hypothetical protein